jgi:tetratricopeptide (TPR) repeat protein
MMEIYMFEALVTHTRLRIAFALLALCALGSPGRADRASNQAAKVHYEAGTKHYDLSEFADALAEFKEAYRLKPDPVFLFNIAQCHRLLKQPQDAISFYRSYLRRSPDAPNRTEVEGMIASLQDQIDHPPPVTPTPEPKVEPTPVPVAAEVVAAPPAPPKKQPIYKKWWLWTAVAGGVVAIGLGVGLGVGLTRGHAPNQFTGVTF